MTYPISVGKMDWKTPLGMTRIVDKRERPIWYPPESVRHEHEADGRPLPKAVPPGPGQSARRIRDAPRHSRRRVSDSWHESCRPASACRSRTAAFACIRKTSQQFFKIVAVNTPVRMIDQPYKMGWRGEELYMEVHAPLEGQDHRETRSLTNITRLLVSATQDRPVVIDWAKAERAFIQATGVPEPVLLRPATVQAAGETPGGR